MAENSLANESVIASKTSSKKKRDGYIFSDDEIQLLIEAWSKREVLFDCKNPNYFKKDPRMTAVNQLVEELGFPGLSPEDVLKKMSGLRTYHGREMGKENASRASGRGTSDVYSSKWPFFHQLHFLRDNITPRKTSSTMQCEPGPSSKYDEIVSNADQEAAGISEPDIPSPEESQSIPTYHTTNPPTKTKRRKLATEDELLACCLQEMKQKQQQSPSTDQLYGQYIGQLLEKVPNDYNKEMLKIQIQQLIVKTMHDGPLDLTEHVISIV